MGRRRIKKKKPSESPTSDCLLLCDDVLVSQGRQKHYIQGIISLIVVNEFPAKLGPYVAYVRLSNIYANQKLKFVFEDTTKDEVLFSFEADTGNTTDPLGVLTLIVPLPQINIEHAGRYIFAANHDSVPFVQSAIIIKLFNEKHGDSQ